MQGTTITLVGNVVDNVVLRSTVTGLSRLSFRVASTERRKDRETDEWVDGQKLFVNVTFWREFAENVAKSVKKGDPIVVTGRLHSRQYVKDETNHISYDLDAHAFGHDLNRGTTKFQKRARGYSGAVEVDADGLPMRPVEDGYILAPEAELSIPDGELSARERDLAPF